MTNLLLIKCNLKALFPVFALIRLTFKTHQKMSGGKFHAPHRRAQLPQCHTTHRPFPHTEARQRRIAADAHCVSLGRHSGRHRRKGGGQMLGLCACCACQCVPWG